mmetsp:Transcript_97007/g.269935  ORF Transcript_97007/g.269935 Transcript_97007/m.269935 type:complete len:292 (-) Transcript_97007:33-908(-)
MGHGAPRHVLEVDVKVIVQVVVAQVVHDVRVPQLLVDAQLGLKILLELHVCVKPPVDPHLLHREDLPCALVQCLEDASQRAVAQNLAADPSARRAPDRVCGAHCLRKVRALLPFVRHGNGRDTTRAQRAREVRREPAPGARELGLVPAVIHVPAISGFHEIAEDAILNADGLGWSAGNGIDHVDGRDGFLIWHPRRREVIRMSSPCIRPGALRCGSGRWQLGGAARVPFHRAGQRPPPPPPRLWLWLRHWQPSSTNAGLAGRPFRLGSRGTPSQARGRRVKGLRRVCAQDG